MANTLDKIIGEAIKKERNLKKISQTNLGLIVGMSRSSIVNIERGYQSVPLLKLLIICFALEIDLSILLKNFKVQNAVDTETFNFIKNKYPKKYKIFISQMIAESFKA